MVRHRFFRSTILSLAIAILSFNLSVTYLHPPQLTSPSFVLALTGTGIIKTAGLAPTSISLSWRQDLSPSSDRYTLQQSSSPVGLWTNIYNSTSGDKSEATRFFTGLNGGQSYWWRLLGISSNGQETELDKVQITQPDYDRLDNSVRGNSVGLNWTNNAAYDQGIVFVSYVVYESANNSARSPIATIDRVDVRTYSVNNLSQRTDYTFTVETIVKCSKCNVSTTGTSVAGPVDVLIVGNFPLSLAATRVAADLGQLITFTCDTSRSPGPVDKVEINFADDATVYYTLSGSKVTSLMNDTRITRVDCNAISGAYRGHASLAVTVSTDPTATHPSIVPATADAGQSVTFSTLVMDGLSGYSYSWKLPDGCEPRDSPIITCQPNVPGMYIVNATVVDHNGYVVTTGPVSFTVYASLEINSFTASPSRLKTGEATTIDVITSKGHGGLSYSYTGLPSGCLSRNSTGLHCNPSSAGTYTIHVTVSDRNGGSAESSLTLTVDNNGGSPSSSSSLLGGSNTWTLVGIIGGILAVTAATILAGVVVLRRRRG